VSEELPAAEWLTFFRELNQCAIMSVCLQGGEPFLRQDLKGIIQGIVNNRMRFSILSNGTMITDEMAGFLASTGRCDSVQVSIDGSQAMFHEPHRGSGNFQKAVQGLRCLMKHNVCVTARVTIHRQNFEDLEAAARFLLDDLQVPVISTNSANCFGLCRENVETVQLSVQERSQAMRILLKLAKRYPERIQATAGPLAEARSWLETERERRAGMTGNSMGGRLTGCGCAFQKLAVRADGIIVPCCQLPSMKLGRINVDTLKEVWLDHPDLKRLRERDKIPLADFDYCSDCQYIGFCTGSCPGLAESVLRDPYQPSPEACYRRFLEGGGVLPDESLLF